jgi:cyclin H
MMAALSLADRSLFERMMQETFHFVPATDNGNDTPAPNGENGISLPNIDQEHIIGAMMRDKVMGTIEACRDMLSKELPENKDHWVQVRGRDVAIGLPILARVAANNARRAES